MWIPLELSDCDRTRLRWARLVGTTTVKLLMGSTSPPAVTVWTTVLLNRLRIPAVWLTSKSCSLRAAISPRSELSTWEYSSWCTA